MAVTGGMETINKEITVRKHITVESFLIAKKD
jgi:hypothetical protein